MNMSRNIGINVKAPEEECNDELCPFHGSLPIRGRLFNGIVVSNKAKKMVVIEREYTYLIKKYKRYERRKSKIHAYLPECIDVEIGDKVTAAECRPLNKTASFVVIEVKKNE
ncbi:MAG: 30S ribosomal protein S17 [Candidatus Nitrosocaldaceae archaeon]|nr:MAG: 30S ribosomal protein S17 [Candidatus Nitrosocaldaceae archaeon]